MKDTTKYVSLDVSKEKIAVAIAEEGRGEPRSFGMIPHTPEAIRELVNKFVEPNTLRVCYEACPNGYLLYRLLLTKNSLHKTFANRSEFVKIPL
jgi:transposase